MTEDDGWYWNSDFEWGWAPFHYGRWVFDDLEGWHWSPDDIWAPAWVEWRYGDEFIGWAPLGPEMAFDAEVALAPPSWVFVPQRQFLAPRLSDVVVISARNESLLRETPRVVTLSWDKGRMINRGVAAERIEKATGRKLECTRIRAVESPAAMQIGVQPKEVQVSRPRTGEETAKTVSQGPRDRLDEQQAAERKALQSIRATQQTKAQDNDRLSNQQAAEQRAQAQAHAAEQQRLERMMQRNSGGEVKKRNRDHE